VPTQISRICRLSPPLVTVAAVVSSTNSFQHGMNRSITNVCLYVRAHSYHLPQETHTMKLSNSNVLSWESSNSKDAVSDMHSRV